MIRRPTNGDDLIAVNQTQKPGYPALDRRGATIPNSTVLAIDEGSMQVLMNWDREIMILTRRRGEGPRTVSVHGAAANIMVDRLRERPSN